MSTPKEWKLVPVEPTEEMKRAYNKACGVEAAKWFIKDAYAELLSAAPTPPKVEPIIPYVCQYFDDGAWHDCSGSDQCHYADDGYETRTLYTSPPFSKASWDAEGNPLNLEAAARDIIVVTGWDSTKTGNNSAIKNLRKFLKGKS